MSITNITPVWKYTASDISEGETFDSLQFKVRLCDTYADVSDVNAGTIIYEGVAAPTAGTTNIYVSINDIVADYLSAPFQTTSGGRWHTQQLGTYFALDYYDSNNSVWTNNTAYFFYKDYSYDYDFDAATMGLSHPITGVLAPNQWAVASGIDVGEVGDVDVVLTFADNTTQTITIPLGRSADFNTDFNADFAISQADPALAGYAALYLGGYPDLVSVRFVCGTITMAEYSVRQDTCKRYCLYYRNSYGGWDSILLDGLTRKEAYTRSTITRWIDNSIQGARGSEDYRNAVVEGWELNINNLTDTQAALMHHLVGSTDVYLCDIIADTLTPLCITDSECTDKTFRNQGKKRVNYKLTAVTAADRTRR